MAVTINGSAGVITNTGAVYNGLQTATTVASTSGTSIEFTSIPSWVKRITVMFQRVSTNGTGNFQVQLGTTSAYEITGYQGGFGVMVNAAATSAGNITTGFGIYNGGAAYSFFGHAVITLLDSATNLWCFSFSGANGNTGNVIVSGGTKALSDALTRFRIIASATGSPSDTFDQGNINIIYE